MKIMFNKSGIGDIIATIYILENFGRKTGQKSEICGSSRTKEICDLYNLSYVKFTTNSSGALSKHNIGYSPRNTFGPGYIHYICKLIDKIKKLNYDYLTATPLKSKFGEYKIGEEVKVQFDSRTAKKLKQQLTNKEMLLFIKHHAPKEKIIVLGGPDTTTYLKNTEYRLGNFELMCKELLHCKLFLGGCSGLSHLAGSLGIHTKLIVDIPEVARFYKVYKNTICYSRLQPTLL